MESQDNVRRAEVFRRGELCRDQRGKGKELTCFFFVIDDTSFLIRKKIIMHRSQLGLEDGACYPARGQLVYANLPTKLSGIKKIIATISFMIIDSFRKWAGREGSFWTCVFPDGFEIYSIPRTDHLVLGGSYEVIESKKKKKKKKKKGTKKSLTHYLTHARFI